MKSRRHSRNIHSWKPKGEQQLTCPQQKSLALSYFSTSTCKEHSHMKCLLLGPKAVESFLKHMIISYSIELEKVNHNMALSPSLSLPFFWMKLRNRLSPWRSCKYGKYPYNYFDKHIQIPSILTNKSQKTIRTSSI